MPVVWKRPFLQYAVLAAVGSVFHWLSVSDVEDCNVCTYKRRGTVTYIEQGAGSYDVNFKAVVMKHVGGTHIMKIWH
jgi:hypothetical protein